MTDTFRFSLDFIGILSAIIYKRLFDGMTSRWLLNFSILIGTATTAAFLMLSNPASAVIINFFSGIAGMIAFVATLSLAKAGRGFCIRGADVASQSVLGIVEQSWFTSL